MWPRLSLRDNLNNQFTPNTSSRRKHFYLHNKLKIQEEYIALIHLNLLITIKANAFHFLETESVYQLHIQLNEEYLLRKIFVILIKKPR